MKNKQDFEQDMSSIKKILNRTGKIPKSSVSFLLTNRRNVNVDFNRSLCLSHVFIVCWIVSLLVTYGLLHAVSKSQPASVLF
jgi:hypothetical protein